MIFKQKTFSIFITCLLFFSPATVLATPIKIGIIGDQTGAYDLDKAYQVLQQGVNILKTQNLDVVIHVGDLIESTQQPDQIKHRYVQATQILNQLPTAWFLTAGDHDVNPPKYQQNSQDRSREELFQELYSTDNPAVKEHLYYSFDVKNYHFIALYSLEYLHTDSRWGNVFYARITDKQYQWLQQDLDKNKDKDAIIVYVHQPLWYNWSSWAKVHDLLKKYPVVAVIAGHFHYNQKRLPLDGIHYRVVGATGGKIKNASPNAGGIHHVTVMTVNRQEVNFQPIPIDKTDNMSFTSRYYMDRIQNLDVMLGNLYNFSQQNPVYLKGNQLVNSCEKGMPAQLKLTSIGNPIGIPVDIAITYRPRSSIQMTSASFANDVCQKTQNPFNCTLFPSVRVYISNTSLVQVQSTPPLWTGTLSLTGSPPSKIDLDVAMSFQTDKSDHFMIYKTVSTPVSVCQN